MLNIAFVEDTHPPWRPAGHWWGQSPWRWPWHRIHAELARTPCQRLRSRPPPQFSQRSWRQWHAWCHQSETPCSRTGYRTYSAEREWEKGWEREKQVESFPSFQLTGQFFVPVVRTQWPDHLLILYRPAVLDSNQRPPFTMAYYFISK